MKTGTEGTIAGAELAGAGADAGTLIRSSVPRLTTITGFGAKALLAPEELKLMLIGGGEMAELEAFPGVAD